MKILAQAPTLALIAVLAACSPTPPPVVTPDAPRPAVSSDTESTPSETPSAVDPEPSAGAIVIGTDAVTVLDAGGSTLSYYVFTSDADAAIAGLTEYFDSDPSIGAIEQGTHNWPAATYTWPGFVLTDWIGGPGIPAGEDFNVAVTAATVGGLAIETRGHITVGSSATATAATGATRMTDTWDGVTTVWYEIDPVAVENEFDNAHLFVRAGIAGTGGPVSTLTAPVASFFP
jgi:hypothetical protein